jgi:hypothetical protein
MLLDLKKYVQFTPLVFWYVALFPGRIGYDNVKLLDLIKSGSSTDWWTSEYYWLIRLLSFNGRSVWLVSLTSLLIGYYALLTLIREFRDDEISHKVVTGLFVFPIVPVFLLTVSHDAFQCSGLILITSCLIRSRAKIRILNKATALQFIAGVLLLTTTYAGQIVALIAIAVLLMQRNVKLFSTSLILLISVMSISGIQVENSIPKSKYLWPMVSDLKCIIQHPDSIVSDDTKKVLQELAPISEWLNPVSCKRMDDTNAIIDQNALGNVNRKKFITAYVKTVANNPQIALMAHIQKNIGLLPPPFFQPPRNMVSWNVDDPVGYGEISSLQSGGAVLHTSIDSARLKIAPSFFKYFEALALFPVFLINQASWFWGWAGMWSYFTIYIIAVNRKKLGLRYAIPSVMLALIFLVTSPESATRYTMYFTIIGITSASLIALRIQEFKKRLIKASDFSK